ncbi:Tautomerase/MIF [Ascobolus immersus RN42]|uniref:L-dopachrome isomerase n=1 Tax=Ascobolus immersus RN42 TaxID=1160509 RepID=A0A3N4IC48_ASCIM|nr:Tautomerase/MIF [Ascobolus immersus RN42]
MGSLPHHRNTPSALSNAPASKVAQLIGRAPPSPAPTNSFEEDYLNSPNSGRPHINDIMREVERDTPGGPMDRSPSRKSSRSNISRQRSKKTAMFYADAFAFRDAGVPVPSIAPVLVELKTNVILEDEFNFTKQLSAVFAKRFSRGEDTVGISVNHSCCMILGGTYDGAYFLTITSLSSISPTCNKRNAALIAEWLNTNLGVAPERGYIRFVEPSVADYATAGSTILDMMEKDEMQRTGSRAASRTGSSRDKKRLHSRQMSRSDMVEEEAPPLPQDNFSRKSDDLALPSTTPKLNSKASKASLNGADGGKRKRGMFGLFSRRNKD